MKHKSLFKTFRSISRIVSVIRKSSPTYLFWMIIKGLVNSLLPFVGIIFSYLILDGLIYQISKDTLYLYIILLISISFVLGLILKIANYYIDKNDVTLQYNLENAIAIKSFQLDYEQVEDQEVMNLIKKAQESSMSSGGLRGYCETLFAEFFRHLLQIIYAIFMLMGMLVIKDVNSDNAFVHIINNPLSALIILFMIIIVTVASSVISTIDNKISYETMLSNIDRNRKYSYFYQVCSNYTYGKDIRLYGMQNMIIKMMGSEKCSIDTLWRNYINKTIQFQIILSVLSKLLLFVSYMYVGLKAIYGLISIGSVVSYVSAITILGTSITALMESYVYILRMNTYLENYFIYLNLPTKMRYGKEVLKGEVEEILFENITFKYPKQEELILDNINLKISKGDKFAIVGQNGAGKTTLIKLLCRLYEPTSGRILINGIDIKEYTQASLYDMFSVVFQDFKLFSFSIKDNIVIGEKPSNDKLNAALIKSGIKPRIDKMDKGVDTIIYQRNNEQGVEISGGEAQKIAIARALYKDAPIVILDEPTAALDPISEAEIYEKFNKMVMHKTSIFISHRMSSCKFCDAIVVMENGKIIQMGPHEELLSQSNGLYKKMWDAQAKYYN